MKLRNSDRSVVSLDHDRTRLGLVRIAGDRRQSLDLFAVDESFPVQHDRDVAPDQPDVVGLPLAWTIGNIKGTIGNIKGRSLAAVDGTGLSDPTLTLCDSPISAAAQSHAADYGSTKTYVNRSTRVQRATSTRDDARYKEGRTHPSQGGDRRLHQFSPESLRCLAYHRGKAPVAQLDKQHPHGFLQHHGVPLEYAFADFEREGATSARLWQSATREWPPSAIVRTTTE